MDRTEFFRRQADRFSRLAKECTDKAVSARLNAIAAEYQDMFDGKASDDSKDRPVAHLSVVP